MHILYAPSLSFDFSQAQLKIYLVFYCNIAIYKYFFEKEEAERKDKFVLQFSIKNMIMLFILTFSQNF